MCGIVGIFGHPRAAELAQTCLFGLQHRGQESAGIVAADGNRMERRAGMGLVADVLRPAVLRDLPGTSAIGHVRYSTAGDSNPANAQPFLMQHHRGPIAVAHNGNLVDAPLIRGEMEDEGSIFQTTTDTETLLHLIARSRASDVVDAIVESLGQVQGAFSLLFLVPGRLIAIRDPMGFRPMCIGRFEGAWVVASESSALELVGADFLRELAPGEVVVVDVAGEHRFHPFRETRLAPCFFEHVYFSRPDSTVFGRSVQEIRKLLGVQLYREHPADGDLVVPVPDSGVYAAMGYARASGMPFEMGLVRNHYIGRTFIQPTQHMRDVGVRIKLNPVRALLEGKSVVLIDDSIVRGTTSGKIVQLCRDAGAREVHVRISCPPTVSPCYFGIDTPKHHELIAVDKSVEEIRRHIDADSLGYLSLDGMLQSAGEDKDNVCTACWTTDYPVALPRAAEEQLRLFEKTLR